MTRKEFLRIMNTGKNKRELLKQFFHFTIPSILSMLAFSLYTMVDGMFVAKGAGDRVKQKRKAAFYDGFVKPLVKEGASLALTGEEITAMIQ